jgi:glucokinase
MLFAADVGGTKTLLGLFEGPDRRPEVMTTRVYATEQFEHFRDVVSAFASDVGERKLSAATAGVAGPVLGPRATLTNRPFVVTTEDTVAAFGVRMTLLNDLQALAYSVDVLRNDELTTLQSGEARANGHAALIAAGTGLGQAYLHRIDGRLVPAASEAGHADFAGRTDRELALVRFLRTRYGRATVEHVLSGPGLENLHAFTHEGADCAASAGLAPGARAAAISAAGLSGACDQCVEALDLFVSAYGAEAGNLALRGLATAGLFVGGGIAPRLGAALADGRFMRAFLDKAPMHELVRAIPVHVILVPESGLIGAAVHAQLHAHGSH